MGPLTLAPPGKPRISMIRGDKTVAKTVSYEYLGNIPYALHRTKGANLKRVFTGSVTNILLKKNYSFNNNYSPFFTHKSK